MITESASPLPAIAAVPPLQPDTSLAGLLAALAPHDDKALVLAYGGGRRVRPGYHVTEVKAASFVTLDCGGNPDAWQETVLQVEDIPAKGGEGYMRVGKFRGILARVDRTVRLSAEARLTIEVSAPGEAMHVHDVAGIEIAGDEAIVTLGARPAVFKPRHRAALAEAAACCAPDTAKAGGSACCA